MPERPIHRIYCETLPYDELVRPRTLSLLRRFELQVVLAVRPWQIGELPGVARALADAGVALSVWPMLSDADGRWASAQNAPAFTTMVRAVGHALDAASLPLAEVLFDMEPPFAHGRALADVGSVEDTPLPHRLRALAPAVLHSVRWLGAARRGADASFERAKAVLAAVVRELRERGIATSSAVWPLVALDPPAGEPWQALLGTPVDGLVTDRVSVMAYTSIFEGWSRGAVRRSDALGLLAAAGDRTMKRWGSRAGLSLGCVGTGAFEDEPVYRSPSELARDVVITRASGCDDLSLFDLGGVLSREPAEAWLEAFVFGEAPTAAPSTARVFAARRLARLATWALSRR